MQFLRNHWLILLAAIAGAAALLAFAAMRVLMMGAAYADLQKRGIYWFEIHGSRIPCSSAFDVGVIVVYQNSKEGERIGGRLCRPPDWWNEWTWHPAYHEDSRR